MSGAPTAPSDPRREAQARLDAVEPGRYEARVLEPSPPAAADPPWFADDPVAPPTRSARTVVSPVPNAELTWDALAVGDAPLTAWCAERWLAGWPPLAPIADPAAWAASRQAWHTLAEHVLAPARHQATGKIGLRFTRGGFGTPFFRAPSGDRQVRVDGTELVVEDGSGHRTPITTLRAAADAAGVAVGVRTGVYEPTTNVEADTYWQLPADAAGRLGDWFGFAASVLEALRAGAADGPANRVQIWPEHFDCSIDLGDEGAGQRGTFGASPGDEQHPLPYLYVTHWADVAADGFWNDTVFGGASLGYDALLAAGGRRRAALAFFRRGVEVLQPA